MDYALKSALIEFKWGAVMAGVITADQALVFGLIKARARCGLAELKQISGLSTIRFNKALELLLVVEKVVIHNDEVIFVPVKPSLAAVSPVVAAAPVQETEPAVAPEVETKKPRTVRASKGHPSSIQEVVDYINGLDREKYAHLFTNPLVDIEGTAEEFFNFYASKGWVVGDNPMKDWTKALARAIGNGKSGGARSNNGWAIRFHNITQVAAKLDAAYAASNAQNVGYVEQNTAPAVPYAARGPVIDVPCEPVQQAAPWNFDQNEQDPVRAQKIEQRVIEQIGLPPAMAGFAQIPNAPTAEESFNFDNALRDYYDRKAKAIEQATAAYASVPTEQI